MAKTQKLNGWQYSLGVEEDGDSILHTSSRRSRRGQTPIDEIITFKRDSDDLEVKVGDTYLVQQAGNKPEVAMIKEIKFGNDNFIDMVVVWYVRIHDVNYDDLPKVDEYKDAKSLNPNEIFITAYLDEILVTEIVDKVNVVSVKEFSEDIVIDDSNSSNTFMTRRACNSAADIFSETFDYRELLKMFTENQNEFVEYIRSATVPTAYKATTSKVKQLKESKDKLKVDKSRKPRVEKKDLKQKDVKIGSSSPREAPDSDVDSIESSDDAEISDEDLSDDPDVAEPSTPTKKRGPKGPRKRTDQQLEGSPRKQAKTLKVSPRKYTKTKQDESPKRSATNSSPSGKTLEYMSSALSPHKKRFKLKSDLPKPSLSISPKKGIVPGNMGVDTTSEIFKQIKAKLHTSARLTTLPGREEESGQIMAKLATAIETETGCCIYVSGTPGVGKTATIRDVLSQLQELSNDGDFKAFDYLEINGLKLLSPNVAYEVLWEKISGYKMSASNAAIVLEKYFSEQDDKKPLVVLMDELDQIVTKKQNVMYNFFNWPTYANSKLVVIAVANTMDLPERVLSNKISSRLGLNRIQFIGYTFEQLGEIIKHRLSMLTKQYKMEVVIDPDAIGFASRKVASVSGDARRALTICRRAVEIAEKEFLSQYQGDENIENEKFHVQISHISRAINETINSPVSQFLAALPFASKLVLHAIILRMKRSGLAENSLGDVIDEMKNSLLMLTSKESSSALHQLDEKATFYDFLYGSGLIDSSNNKKNIRIMKFKNIVNELVENGILMQQNIPGERYRLIQLNISEEEVSAALKRDKELTGL